MSSGRRVVVVHDYLTQRGGAERVTLDLLRAFEGARLVTSCWNPATTYEEFADFDVETLWINAIGPLRRDPRRAFPFLAGAFAGHTITDADVVICSSSGWAHRVTTTAPKVVYCHNPARWLYQPYDYFDKTPSTVQRRFAARTGSLRRSDFAAAHTAAAYLVNSSVVAGRVEDIYGITPILVPPARGLSADGPMEPILGIKPGYMLTISRPRAYKHAALVIDAVTAMPGERLVVVGGDGDERLHPTVTTLRHLSDAQLRWVYANADGLIAVAFEDFGLTPVEAQGFGVPAIVLRGGGYLDSTVEDVTGVFIEAATVDEIVRGIRELRSRPWSREVLRRHGERYTPAAFHASLHQIVGDVTAKSLEENNLDQSLACGAPAV